ncbi:glycerophosphodiester phosphodiesterase family protein [Alphaproteobacteria bacterium]|nr:glycerophosphodiester phosphodiesterase family protein [Alphaproteobacteria bacterium]
MTAYVKNIAHRGGAALWPENTIIAFSNAIDMGADGIELDLQLSSDGALIIYHDDRLRPTNTQRDGKFIQPPGDLVKNLSLAQLQALDVGTDLNRRDNGLFTAYQGTPVPSWDDFMSLIDAKAPSQFLIYAELKTSLGETQENKALSEAFITAIAPRKDRERIHLVSFDWRCINRLRERFPDLNHAYTTLEFSITDPDQPLPNDRIETHFLRNASQNGAHWFGSYDWRAQKGNSHGEKILNAIAAAQGTGWFAYWRDITPERLAQAQALGIKVGAWTVNEQADMSRLKAMGIDAIITDRPDALKALDNN